MEDRNASGKWLIFVAKEELDATWEVIREETEAGRLGCRSKVSTAFRNTAEPVVDKSKGAICVFTYDSRDLAEARRVRERLRQLGFVGRLAYKTNEATRAGRYGEPSDLSVHLLFE